MAVDWHSGSSGGRMSESPHSGSNESTEMRNGVITSSKVDHMNGERVPSRESNKSSRESKGRNKIFDMEVSVQYFLRNRRFSMAFIWHLPRTTQGVPPE